MSEVLVENGKPAAAPTIIARGTPRRKIGEFVGAQTKCKVNLRGKPVNQKCW
jgi:hypothetical protein